jgi:hypothetical protein
LKKEKTVSFSLSRKKAVKKATNVQIRSEGMFFARASTFVLICVKKSVRAFKKESEIPEKMLFAAVGEGK